MPNIYDIPLIHPDTTQPDIWNLGAKTFKATGKPIPSKNVAYSEYETTTEDNFNLSDFKKRAQQIITHYGQHVQIKENIQPANQVVIKNPIKKKEKRCFDKSPPRIIATSTSDGAYFGLAARCIATTEVKEKPKIKPKPAVKPKPRLQVRFLIY